jgi:hypothetical protein
MKGVDMVIDEDRNLAHVGFGDIVESHKAAVDFVRASTEVSVDRRFKTVVTSAAGYPLDATYYQTVKGMVTPMDIMEPGATLIIASGCSEGLGSKAYREAQRKLVELGPDAFLATLLGKRFADVDEWQTEMQLKPMRLGSIKLFTEGLSDDDLALTGVDPVDSVDAVIPEGPHVVPFGPRA